MPVIEHKQFINAPIEICFNLARNVDIQPSLKIKKRVVGCVTEGLLEEGDIVSWEAVHFGIKQRLTSRVIIMEKPHSFVDKMIKGAFRSFIHIHQFIEEEEGTTMINHFQYKSRFGPIGVIIDNLFLAKYMKRFIVTRAIEIKKIAEIKTNQTFD